MKWSRARVDIIIDTRHRVVVAVAAVVVVVVVAAVGLNVGVAGGI